MSAEVKIQRLSVVDAAAFVALRRVALETEPWAFGASADDDVGLVLESVRTSLGDHEGQAVFGQFDGAELIGTVGLIRASKVKQRHKATIWGMYVLPRARNKGVGRALLDAAIQHARGWGLDHLQLSVTEAAPTAKRLYEAAGFRPWGQEPRALHWKGRFLDEYHLVLNLREPRTQAAEDSREPQNIYDDQSFFAGYSTLERFGAGWERAMEHADLLALLPKVDGRRVLDLGCGAGQLAHYLATTGAAEVVGVDVSERMLALARAGWAHPRVTYCHGALEDLAYPPARFDLVVSSLVLHYVDDYPGLVLRIAEWLAPGGILVYSTEHPIFTARLPGDGWVLDDAGRRTRWGLDRYADEGAREETWFVPGVRKVHRTLATLINGLVDAGLVVERIVEPIPGEQWLQDHPLAHDERRRPIFLLVRARKP